MRPLGRRALLLGAVALGATACAPRAAGDTSARPLDLSDLERRHGGRLGVAVGQGTVVAAWRDERFLYASTFKLFLAAAVLEQVRAQPDLLARRIPVTQADIVFHAPVTASLAGGEATVEQLCRAAVEVSDNTAANLLIRELGGLGAWRDWYRSMGDTVTRVDRPETALNRPDGELDTTTPVQTVTNLGVLFTGLQPRLDAGAQAQLLAWLEGSPTGAERIRAGLPAGWRDATKTGSSGAGHFNDIGLVLPPQGEPVRIAVYYEAMDSSREDQADAVIAEATRRALGALGHG